MSRGERRLSYALKIFPVAAEVGEVQSGPELRSGQQEFGDLDRSWLAGYNTSQSCWGLFAFHVLWQLHHHPEPASCTAHSKASCFH